MGSDHVNAIGERPSGIASLVICGGKHLYGPGCIKKEEIRIDEQPDIDSRSDSTG